MKIKKRKLELSKQEERGHIAARGCDAIEMSNISEIQPLASTKSAMFDEVTSRMRSAQRLMDEVASRIPPFSPEQIHALVEGDNIPQFQLRRRCDRYLLIFCLLLLALAASILWHTDTSALRAPQVLVPVAILSVADLWVALRAARSLWLMRQTLRLRPYPYRMSRYADRLGRLSRRRRRWLGFVLAGSYNSVTTHVDPSTRSTGACTSRREFFSLRLPSYSIAACIFLLIVLNADKAFAATRDFVKVTTTSEKTDDAICDTINNTIEQL
jgi:hypothetical protein